VTINLQPKAEPSAPSGRRSRFQRHVIEGPAGAYIGVLVVLVAMVLYLGATQPTFLAYGNLLIILNTNAVLLVVSVGLTIVLLVGGFDLSVGGMLALSGVVLGHLLTKTGTPPVLAILVCIVGGFVIGALVNGLLIARLKLSFFVVTIGAGSLFGGLALVVAGGAPVGIYTVATIRSLGSGTVAGVPNPVVVALGVFAVFVVILRYTGFGRMIYAVGGNAEAARMAGIRVDAVRMACYSIAGGLAALAGVLQASRLASASPSAGIGIELTAAAAVLLGGTSFAGGSGTLLGTLLGTLFLGVLSNGLTLSGVSAFWQGVVTGAVLILAVAIDRYRETRTLT
jgi:ribose transport system permease protein